MSKKALVFEVNQKSFNQYVLLNSHKVPVIVEFMGVWSGPCVSMDLLFSGLAKEFPEKFIFAKVDIDEQKELAKEYKINNIPTCLVFKDGALVRTEEGELKELETRSLLKDFGIFHQSDLLREQAREKHLAGDTPSAIIQLTEAIKADPANTLIAMDMVQIFIDIGELEQANNLYSRLPQAAQNGEMGKQLNGQLLFAGLAANTDDLLSLQKRLAENPSDYEALFDLSIQQISKYQFNEAIDNLFKIHQQAPTHKEGAAKEMLITVANMSTSVNNKLAQEIRRKLANDL